jgi:two-component system response regulator (stage 0 sporulation protein F)
LAERQIRKQWIIFAYLNNLCYRGGNHDQGVNIMAKILIVDDEEHIRFLYSEELTEAGYEVITADSGYQLLEKIEDEKPDLVVLDIKMMDYNGLDLLQDIRNKFYNLPVVLCTAYDTFKEDMKSIAADFYVIKSFDLTELKSKISMALEANAAVE